MEQKDILRVISSSKEDANKFSSSWNGNELKNEHTDNRRDIYDEVKELKVKMDGMTKIIEKLTKLMEIMCDGKKDANDDDDEKQDEMKKLLKGLKEQKVGIGDKLNGNVRLTEKEELRHWFENNVGLSQYYQLFIDHGFEELSVVRELNMTHLEQIGVKKLGHRIRIKQEITKLSAFLNLQ